MSKLIFDIHIDIPTAKLDTDLGPYGWDTMDRSARTKLEYNSHHDKLVQNKKDYAKHIDADYLHFGRDHRYLTYLAMMQSKHPHLSEYLIINFYKHQLMRDLAEEYDQILYVDFDVVFQTQEDYFEAWDFQDGMHVWAMDYSEEAMAWDCSRKLHLRSMINKHFIAEAMLMEEYEVLETPVINTGIIGASWDWIKKLDFPEYLDDMIRLIDHIKYDPDSMYPESIQSTFDWNNEPLFTYLIQKRQVPLIHTNGTWNACVSESHDFTTPEHVAQVKIAHMINKRFDWIWP